MADDRTIRVTLDVKVRPMTKKEFENEGNDADDHAEMSGGVDTGDLGEAIAFHVEESQDEVLAGSDMFIKIKSVKLVKAEDVP